MVPKSSNEFGSETIKLRRLLISEMTRSKRTGAWFNLKRSERSLYSLALRLNVKLESVSLIRAIVSVLKKLKEYGGRLYNELAEGSRLAWILSSTAVAWGNKEARSWRSERKYIIFLGTFSVAIGRPW